MALNRLMLASCEHPILLVKNMHTYEQKDTGNGDAHQRDVCDERSPPEEFEKLFDSMGLFRHYPEYGNQRGSERDEEGSSQCRG